MKRINIILSLLLIATLASQSQIMIPRHDPERDGYMTKFKREFCDRDYLSVYNPITKITRVYDADWCELCLFTDAVPNQMFGDGRESGICLTQYLFNDDDNFEYFATSQPDEPTQWWGIKSGYYKFLYKEEGIGAMRVNIVSLWSDYQNLMKYFCSVDGRLYIIYKDTDGVKVISDGKNLSYPNPVKRGEAFNIDISGLKKVDSLELVVTEINGRMKSENTITEIDTQIVNIDTGRYAPGIYVYSLNDSDKVVRSGKMIVE